MKSPHISAQEHLANAANSISEAQKALRLSGKTSGPSWLLMEAIARTAAALETVEIAGAHVHELMEHEGVRDPLEDIVR